MNAQPYPVIANPTFINHTSHVKSERKLLESCLRGERDGQRLLYEQYCEKVYGLMCRMVGASNADDLTQQVFMQVFRKLALFRGRSMFATWLYRLATNEALQFLRSNHRNVSMSPFVGDLVDESPSALTGVDQRDLLEWTLSQLDPELRAILLLREVDGLSYYDIALALDIAEGTVASRLNRARHCLRELIEQKSI